MLLSAKNSLLISMLALGVFLRSHGDSVDCFTLKPHVQISSSKLEFQESYKLDFICDINSNVNERSEGGGKGKVEEGKGERERRKGKGNWK